jgi:hypothetical protein
MMELGVEEETGVCVSVGLRYTLCPRELSGHL